MSRKTLPEILERFTNVADFPELPLALKREVLKKLSAEMEMQQKKIRCTQSRIVEVTAEISELAAEIGKAENRLEEEKRLLEYLSNKLFSLTQLL